jgi:predicted nucleic acid-binding protein
MIPVALDTNILFSAIFKSAGTQARLLDRVLADSAMVLFVSPAVLAEYHYHEALFCFVPRPHAAKVKYLLSLLTTFAILVVPTASVTAATDPPTTIASSNARRRPTPTTLLPATGVTFQRPEKDGNR